MKKALKAALSCLLTLCILLTPFSGVLVFAQGESGPDIRFNISSFDYVTADTTISVTYTAQGDATLSSCDTRLEGTTISTAASVEFTPKDKKLSNGIYTLVAEATDSNGTKAIETISFRVVDTLDIGFSYADDESIVPSVDGSTAAYHEVTPLNYSVGYGSTADGSVSFSDTLYYDDLTSHNLQYGNVPVQNSSAAGIPYQTFDVDLNGKTDGEVVVRYTGSTYTGERVALKVYNPSTSAWDVVGTFNGSGSVSASVDVATYNVSGEIRVAAVLDYVSNGSDTMIWSTDPQHYTKFEDLYDYYYKVYQYAASEYVDGNVGYIITTGDLVDDRPTSTAAVKQWQVADQAMSYIEEVGMPNGLVSGNHDVGDFKKADYSEGAPNVDYSKFWETFPASRYNDKPWYGGSLNNNASHYDLITIGNVDFVILYLGYGVEATDETIAWANDVLQTYNHRTAIVATHQYLDAATADRSPASRAQLLYDSVIDPNPNVKMVICGHDDGSIVNELTASDGRTVYELLSDYQFVEAEDPDFYANEHYIGSVSSCCGDGYIRLLTVKGDTLSSITYSPVTNRYNPYGDRENISIDLNVDAPDRYLNSVAFSSYVLGDEITAEEAASVPSALVITKAGDSAEDNEPVQTNAPATPDNPYYAHAASNAPNVEYKTDLLKAAGLSDNAVNTGWTPYQGLNLNVDLTKTPYLYYSIDVPAEGNFTFALVNNTNYAPWLVFRDATGEGAFLNNGNGVWDTYTERQQYITASETGCVDMRTISTDPNKATWIVTQLTFYNSIGKEVTVNYMFFGSEPIADEAPVVNEGYSSYHHVSYTDIPETPEAGTNSPVDLTALEALITTVKGMDFSIYTENSVLQLLEAQSSAEAIDTTDAAAVSNAYFALTCAIGDLEKPTASIDPSTLESIHKYDMTPSKWTTSDTVKTALDGTGFKLSRNTTNGWASVNISDAYSIKPNNGKIYVLLDVDADCSWSIHLAASQANTSSSIVINHAIDNAFNRTNCDSMNGVYSGVYDITKAFVAAGMDPNATIEISKTYLYIVPGEGSPQYTDLATNPDTVDYRYVELLTDIAATDVIDTTELQALIDGCAELDEALYTIGSWKKLQAALTNANAALTKLETTPDEVAQADINLETIKLETVIGKLKLLTDVVPEPEGSLLPADEGNWVEYQANTSNVYRDDNNYTVIENTNGMWPSLSYTYPEALTYTVADHQLSVDMTVGINSRVDLLVAGTWVNVGKYITGGNMNGEDMLGGTYTVGIPLSDIFTTETVTISATRVYSIGSPATSSAVVIRQMQITDYVAPPPVEDVCLDLIPENEEEWTLVSGDGSVTVENGVMTIVNNADTDLRVTINKKDYFDLSVLNSLHMQFKAEMPFKMAYHIVSSNDTSKGNWPNTSDLFSHIFEITNDRAAAGEYDVQLEMRDNCPSITDKSSVYFDSFIILLTGKGTFTLDVAEMIAHDNFEWDENMTTYGPAATPTNPYYAHAAKTAPDVAEKYDLLKAIDYPTHPTISAWTMVGNQASAPLGLEIDISKTPYLYYSFAMEEGANFTFAFYSNSNYAPWLSFMDCAKGEAVLNEGAANWDSYTNREQYAVTSQTGCIDMRQYLKNPAVQKWIINQITFYNSTGKNVTMSYFFFGSEPIEEEPAPDPVVGDINADGTIDIADAMKAFYAINGSADLTEEEALLADVNNDGVITLADATRLFYIVSGAITPETA